MFFMIPSRSAVIGYAALLLASVIVEGEVSASVTLPYSQGHKRDRQGREWNIDQNGNIQRTDSNSSLISNAASVMLGGQQFYCQKPTTSADGSLLVMPGPKPYNGIAVTRQLRFLEKEGGVAYADEFSNITGRQIQTVIEFRYHFSGQIKKLVTDGGRPSPTALEAGEQGIIVEPTQNDGTMPAVVLTLSDTRSETPPRLALRNGYQLSVMHSITIPPGEAVTILHSIGQVDLSGDGSTDTLTRNFRDWELKRLAKLLPKDWTKNAVNLVTHSPAKSLQAWFPDRHWGIDRGPLDVVALGDESTLKGRAKVEGFHLSHTFGKAPIEWDNVAAIAGRQYGVFGQSHVWLTDGQILKGKLTASTNEFQLLSGTAMPLNFARLDRLVTHSPIQTSTPTPHVGGGLVETWTGERFAFSSSSSWHFISRWGEMDVPWKELILWDHDEGPEVPPLLITQDGSRLRVWGQGKRIRINTPLFGEQTIAPETIHRAIHPQAISVSGEPAEEPNGTFLDLIEDQRVVASVTNASVSVSTSTGPIRIAPGEIRELIDVSDEIESPSAATQKTFQLELWGGSSVRGQLMDPFIEIEASGFQWSIPTRDVQRWVNPQPRIQTHVLRRTAELIDSLGHPNWQTREAASRELGELGRLAESSLREALKQSSDPEVIRRIETLLFNEP